MNSPRANLADLPPHLKSIVGDLEKSDQQARQILNELSDEQANWRPAEASWSIAQCLDHLTRTNNFYVTALSEALKDAASAKMPSETANPSAPIQPGWFGRFFIANLEPPPRRKLPAPKKIVPATQISARDALDGFLGSQEAVRGVIHEGAGFDLNRIRFRNPFIGFLRFTVGTGLLVIAAHDRRHLWQAERVRECPEFPKS